MALPGNLFLFPPRLYGISPYHDKNRFRKGTFFPSQAQNPKIQLR
jgi:hypothetical protein